MNLACYQFYAASDPMIPPHILGIVVLGVVLGFALPALAVFALRITSSSRPQPKA